MKRQFLLAVGLFSVVTALGINGSQLTLGSGYTLLSREPMFMSPGHISTASFRLALEKNLVGNWQICQSFHYMMPSTLGYKGYDAKWFAWQLTASAKYRFLERSHFNLYGRAGVSLFHLYNRFLQPEGQAIPFDHYRDFFISPVLGVGLEKSLNARWKLYAECNTNYQQAVNSNVLLGLAFQLGKEV